MQFSPPMAINTSAESKSERVVTQVPWSTENVPEGTENVPQETKGMIENVLPDPHFLFSPYQFLGQLLN